MWFIAYFSRSNHYFYSYDYTKISILDSELNMIKFEHEIL